jgi:hypothetical protein
MRLSWPGRTAMPPPYPGTMSGSGRDRVTVGSCERHESRSRIETAEGVVSGMAPSWVIGCRGERTRLPISRGFLKIATFNVNGVNGRLPVLQRWLDEAKPDVVCLQELKAPQGKFPVKAICDAGYGAIWHGSALNRFRSGQGEGEGRTKPVRARDPESSARGEMAFAPACFW